MMILIIFWQVISGTPEGRIDIVRERFVSISQADGGG